MLVKPWRLLAPLEGLVGVLMCGLSMGYFFVFVNRMHQSPGETTAAAPGKETK